MQSVKLTLLKNKLMRQGFAKYMAKIYAKLIIEDKMDSKLSSQQQKWARERGFLSCRINHYGLNEENYRNYLSDYDYYRMFPLNGYERKWIDDKLTTKYVLAPFDEFLPAYYYMLNKNRITILPNAEHNGDKATINDVMDLIAEKGQIALKKEAAAGGDGFYKASFVNGRFYINSDEYSREKLFNFLSGLDNYLVTEYIVAHQDIRKYYDLSAGVLRVMVINEGEPIIANAYLRVGSSKSGFIDAYTGSISAVVDVETGRYNEGYMHSGMSFVRTEYHPDSNIKFAGVIPKWDFVKGKLLEISRYIPQLSYLGFDVCVTDNGFKLFEINSHQGIELYQLSYPLLKDNPAAEYFRNHIK